MLNSAQTRQPLGDVSNKVTLPSLSSQRKRHQESVSTSSSSAKKRAKEIFCVENDSPQAVESNNRGNPPSFLDEFGPVPTASNDRGSNYLSKDDSFDLDKLSELLENAQLSSNSESLRDDRSRKRSLKSLEDNTKSELIYSSSPSLSPRCSSELDSMTSVSSPSTSASAHDSILENASVIPHSGLSEEEEWGVINSDHNPKTHEEEDEPPLDVKFVRWVFPVPPPVFMTEPAISNYAAERKLQPIKEETFEPPSRAPAQPNAIQSKALNPQSPESVSTALDSVQTQVSSKLRLNRPSIPSLLSFTDDTLPSDRQRVHSERYPRSRYGPTDPDTLRRLSFEHLKIARTTGLRSTSTSETSNMSQENYAVFPRAGNLIQLRQEEHTSLFDDWSLSFVDLSVIKRSLYAFDLRMRSGTGLSWAEEEDIKQLIGYHQDWEHDWDKRWRVASLLFSDDEDDTEEAF